MPEESEVASPLAPLLPPSPAATPPAQEAALLEKNYVPMRKQSPSFVDSMPSRDVTSRDESMAEQPLHKRMRRSTSPPLLTPSPSNLLSQTSSAHSSSRTSPAHPSTPSSISSPSTSSSPSPGCSTSIVDECHLASAEKQGQSMCASGKCSGEPSNSEKSKKKTKKSVVFNLSEEKKGEEEEVGGGEDDYGLVACLWKGCGVDRRGENELYDHIIEAHVNVLPSSKPTDAERDAFLKRRQEAERQRKERRRRRKQQGENESSDDSEEEEEDEMPEHFRCSWEGCDMFLARGSDDKKLTWLRDHLATRHLVRAQTVRCLLQGCGRRFRSTRQLDDHIRILHQAAEAKKAKAGRKRQSTVAETTAAASGVAATAAVDLRPTWQPAQRAPPVATLADWLTDADHGVFDAWAYARYSEMHECNFKYRLLARRVKKQKCGSEWRKERRQTVLEIQPLQEGIEEETEQLLTDKIIDLEVHRRTTFDDLFPPPRLPYPSPSAQQDALLDSFPSSPSVSLSSSSLLSTGEGEEDAAESSATFFPLTFASGACHPQRGPPEQQRPAPTQSVGQTA